MMLTTPQILKYRLTLIVSSRVIFLSSIFLIETLDGSIWMILSNSTGFYLWNQFRKLSSCHLHLLRDLPILDKLTITTSYQEFRIVLVHSETKTPIIVSCPLVTTRAECNVTSSKGALKKSESNPLVKSTTLDCRNWRWSETQRLHNRSVQSLNPCEKIMP